MGPSPTEGVRERQAGPAGEGTPRPVGPPQAARLLIQEKKGATSLVGGLPLG